VRHDLGEMLIIAFVAVLCGAQSCAEMAELGRVKLKFFKRFLKLRHGVPSHDTFSTVLRMIDPKALDAAFGEITAQLVAPLAKGGVFRKPTRRGTGREYHSESETVARPGPPQWALSVRILTGGAPAAAGCKPDEVARRALGPFHDPKLKPSKGAPAQSPDHAGRIDDTIPRRFQAAALRPPPI
jgi:hypothetical protein